MAMEEKRVVFTHSGYTVRPWAPEDRNIVADIIKQCLESYGLQFEPQGADLDAIEVEDHYLKDGRGEFWVVVDDASNRLVGTGGYHEVPPGPECEGGEEVRAVEIRKMYLAQEARGKKLGRKILEVINHVFSPCMRMLHDTTCYIFSGVSDIVFTL